MHASTVVLALLAASQVIAAPTPANNNENNARSLKAVGAAVAGGVASGVAGAVGNAVLNNKRSEVDARSLTAIGNFISGIFNKRELDERSLSAIENFVGGIFNKREEPLDARSLTAIGNFISGIFNKREQLDDRSLSAIGDAISGFAEDVLGPTTAKRSLKAVGAAVAGGVASGVAGAVGNAVLGNKRSEPSGLMVDTETGTIYMDIPDQNGARSLKAVGAAVAGGVASGVAGAVGNAVLNNKRSDLMVDTDTGVIYMDVPDSNQGRSLKAVGTAVAGGIAAGAAGAIGNAVLGNRRSEPSGLMVDTETGTLHMEVPDANEGRSLKAVGTAVAGGIAAGAAGAIGNAVLGNRDVDALEARSLKAVGTAVAGGIAAGAAGAIGNAVLNNKRGLMVDTDTGVLYMNVPDANGARSIGDDDLNDFVPLPVGAPCKRSELIEMLAKRFIDDLE